jgi:predicted RNA-binding Zn-ribbon protein involved in translation (DUF1610 family)
MAEFKCPRCGTVVTRTVVRDGKTVAVTHKTPKGGACHPFVIED